ncbi:MAG: SRPBCC family protein [Novosphingobium sp.]
MRSLFLPIIAAAILGAAPAGAEVLQSSDAGFVVREVVEVPADNWASWAALTAPAKWWSSDHTWSGKAENLYIDSQATGCFCELMPVPAGAPEGTRRASAEHMHVVQSVPGKVLRMKGALGPLQSEAVEGVLTITLKTTPKGTRILWEYAVGGYMRFKPEVISKGVDGVLAAQAASLGKLLGAADMPQAEAKMSAEPVADLVTPAGLAVNDAGTKPAEGDISAQFDAAVDAKSAPKPKPKSAAKPVAKRAAKTPLEKRTPN